MKRFVFLFLLSFGFVRCNYVACRLDGQLGNQFFQIAHMLAFAWDNNLIPIMPDEQELKYIAKATYSKNSEYFYKLLLSDENKDINEEDWSIFQEDFSKKYQLFELGLKTKTKFYGFFENYKYFDKYKEKIIDLFQLPINRQLEIKEKFKDIFKHKNIVAVHIRTGDYPRILYFPGFDFYHRKMSTFDKDTLFVVCSDRPEWVKEKLKDWDFNIVYPESDHITEFYLMTQCHHIICSIESTFAFWAAYLNTNPNKKVFAHNGVVDFTDWYPQEWDVEVFPAKKAADYPDMGLYGNKSLDNN